MAQVVAHPTPGAFLNRAEPWLMKHEDRYNLMLSLAYARERRGALPEDDALLATVERGGELIGSLVRTPPYKLLVTDLPLDAAPAVARGVAERYAAIPAILGPKPVAEAVAAAWVDLRGGRVHLGLEQLLYRLDRVVPLASPPPGRLRMALPNDYELALAWGEGFAQDLGRQFAARPESISGWIARGELYLWEVDGDPSSVALAGGRTRRGCRIGYVYTPPALRGRGYASACVAALSQRMLDEGYAFCVLYTVAADPTSNAIYQRVGYELISDVGDFEILPA